MKQVECTKYAGGKNMSNGENQGRCSSTLIYDHESITWNLWVVCVLVPLNYAFPLQTHHTFNEQQLYIHRFGALVTTNGYG